MVLNQPSDYLIFGHFYGFCMGSWCIQIYKLEKISLLEDTSDNYLRHRDISEVDFIELSKTEFDMVTDITTFFPNNLLNETDTILGCPDCADGGGLYFEYNLNDLHKSWHIDQVKSNVPDYLHDFMDLVNEKITLIRTHRCTLEPDPGPCKALILKYYFDREVGKCKEFIWGGCDGAVPFHTLKECEDSRCDL